MHKEEYKSRCTRLKKKKKFLENCVILLAHRKDLSTRYRLRILFYFIFFLVYFHVQNQSSERIFNIVIGSPIEARILLHNKFVEFTLLNNFQLAINCCCVLSLLKMWRRKLPVLYTRWLYMYDEYVSLVQSSKIV